MNKRMCKVYFTLPPLVLVPFWICPQLLLQVLSSPNSSPLRWSSRPSNLLRARINPQPTSHFKDLKTAILLLMRPCSFIGRLFQFPSHRSWWLPRIRLVIWPIRSPWLLQSFRLAHPKPHLDLAPHRTLLPRLWEWEPRLQVLLPVCQLTAWALC